MATEPRPLFRASETARLCIASQAPGKRAYESRLTFNDAKGDRLRAWMGLTRDEFYDTSRVAPAGPSWFWLVCAGRNVSLRFWVTGPPAR
jgi:uracil-DNA glycosylase